MDTLRHMSLFLFKNMEHQKCETPHWGISYFSPGNTLSSKAVQQTTRAGITSSILVLAQVGKFHFSIMLPLSVVFYSLWFAYVWNPSAVFICISFIIDEPSPMVSLGRVLYPGPAPSVLVLHPWAARHHRDFPRLRQASAWSPRLPGAACSRLASPAANGPCSAFCLDQAALSTLRTTLPRPTNLSPVRVKKMQFFRGNSICFGSVVFIHIHSVFSPSFQIKSVAILNGNKRVVFFPFVSPILDVLTTTYWKVISFQFRAF